MGEGGGGVGVAGSILAQFYLGGVLLLLVLGKWRPANEDKTQVGPARFLLCTLSVRMQIIESECDNVGSVPISDIKRPSILI